MKLNMSISFILLQCLSAIFLMKNSIYKESFCCLCQPVKALQPGEHYFKPHLRTLLLSAKPVHCKVAHTPTSTQVTTVNLHVSTKKESVKPVHPEVLHAAPSSTRTTAIISTKKQPTGTKRKQIWIDALLPKKRVCETQTSATSHGDSPNTSQAFSFPNVTPTTEKSDTKMPRISKENLDFRISGQMILTTT